MNFEMNDNELEQVNAGFGYTWDGISGYFGTSEQNESSYPYVYYDKNATLTRARYLRSTEGKSDLEICQILKAEGLLTDRW